MTTPVRNSRWTLHRGGVVNIWQYAEQEFDFSGGRAIFQGTNGSGKSRTLELLLPLCLDGDLRYLGSKGFDTVSIRRLMLDDYDGGPNRIGYAWVELCQIDDAGNESYVTCGIGIKASKASQQITDSWRFITPVRVGTQLRLVGADRIPLSPGQLREVIGADRIFDDAGFRAEIAETIYGVPAARYADLLHLQRTLRNPDVGLKVLEGQLEQILSDALPPLDFAVIDQLAASFDDLESIRENTDRLSLADSALAAFLAAYSDYVFTGLRTAGRKVTSSSKSLSSLRSDLASLEEKFAASREERGSIEIELSELEGEESELDARIQALKELPTYRGMRDLQDREQLVIKARTSAETALDTAGRQRGQEERAIDSVLAVSRRLRHDLASAEELNNRVREALSAAGLDTQLCPHIPAFTPVEVLVSQEIVRAKPNPDAPALTIERRSLPAMDPHKLLDELGKADQAAELAIAEVRRRSAVTLSLHEKALESDRQFQAVEEFRRAARQAQLASTEAAGRRNEAWQQLITSVDVWREQATRWADQLASLIQGIPADIPLLPTAELLMEDRNATRTTRSIIRKWGAPRLQELRQNASAIDQRLTELRKNIVDRETDILALRSARADQSTDRPTFSQLVDFAPAVSDADRAGLEAAMQATGLLDAVVSATGELADTQLAEVLAVAAPAVDGASLADVLIPATWPGCPVPDDVVVRLLRAVAVVAQPAQHSGQAGLAVSVDGQWRVGVLYGMSAKPVAELIGPGARAEARQRRITELSAELDELHAQVAVVQRQWDQVRETSLSWERHIDAFPDDGDLIAAHAKLQGAKDAAEHADNQGQLLRQQHSAHEERWRAARADLARLAAQAGIQCDTLDSDSLVSARDTDMLDRAHRAASVARTSIEQLNDVVAGRCAHTVADLIDAVHHYHTTRADRVDVEAAADALCAEYAEQAKAFDDLASAIGGEAKETAVQLSTLDDRRRAVRRMLPAKREHLMNTRETASRLEALIQSKNADLLAKQDVKVAAEAAFQDIVSAQGMWLAAFPDAEPPQDTESALLQLESAAERKPVAEGAIIAKLQTLQNVLSGSHDISAGTTGGMLAVTVTGEHGPMSVAEAARAVRIKLAEQRGFLGDRYQTIFADYLIRDLAERLRCQIDVAEDLCRRMNAVLDTARSSQGVHVQLEWRPAAGIDARTAEALSLIRMPLAARSAEQDSVLRQVITERIESERDARSGDYAEILTRALDYRSWHSFAVRVRDQGIDGKSRVRRLRQLSSGETRLVSYVTLFAAAAAFYDAVSVHSAEVAPLRLVLLDEAFERLDDPTIARMLGLLVDLDMDWLITWPSGWGVSPKIPRMHIYDVLRPKNGRGVACTHTTWNGNGLARDDL